MSDYICGHRILAEMIKQAKIRIVRIEKDFPVNEFDNKNWRTADEITVQKYWSNEIAPVGRHFKAKLLWSDAALYVRFCANQTEPLIVSGALNLESKTIGLWERDVCEIFVAPDKNNPQKYFEFEIAPSGEWLDLAIHQMPNGRETDFGYDSEMRTSARVEKDKVLMTTKIDWRAFGKTPKTGDIWLGNILRCVGAGETRGYLTWQPTLTKEPSFHVPEKFGEFLFVKF